MFGTDNEKNVQKEQTDLTERMYFKVNGIILLAQNFNNPKKDIFSI